MFSDITGIVAGFAILGTVLGCIIKGWNECKEYFRKISNLIVVQNDIADETTALAVLNYLVKNYKFSLTRIRKFGGTFEYTKDGSFGHIPYENFNDRSTLFWQGWKPILFHIKKEEKKNDTPSWWGEQKKEKQVVIIYPRGLFDIEKIIKEASELRNKMLWSTGQFSDRKRFFTKNIPDPLVKDYKQKNSVGSGIAWYQEDIYRLLSHKKEDIGLKDTLSLDKPLDNLLFPDNILNVIEEIKIWKNNREWYHKRNIRWKKGLALYGVPGTGKTAICRALAEELDMPLFIFSLGELINDEFKKSYRELQAHIPCIAIFEDFDNVFHGRENVYGKDKVKTNNIVVTGQNNDSSSSNDSLCKIGMLSFDCLLNTLDGVNKEEGVLTIFTMNDITKLDWALGQPTVLPDGTIELISSRPGRIDQAVELKAMDQRERIKMAHRILEGYPEGIKRMLDFIEQTSDINETPAQCQERCAQLALTYLQESLGSAKKEALEIVRNRLLRRDKPRSEINGANYLPLENNNARSSLILLNNTHNSRNGIATA